MVDTTNFQGCVPLAVGLESAVLRGMGGNVCCDGRLSRSVIAFSHEAPAVLLPPVLRIRTAALIACTSWTCAVKDRTVGLDFLLGAGGLSALCIP